MGSVKAYSINIDTQTSCCSSLRQAISSALGVDCVVSVPFHSLHLFIQCDPSVSKSIAAKKMNTHVREGGMIFITVPNRKPWKIRSPSLAFTFTNAVTSSTGSRWINSPAHSMWMTCSVVPLQPMKTCVCVGERSYFSYVQYLLKLTVNTLHTSVHHVLNNISPATNTGHVWSAYHMRWVAGSGLAKQSTKMFVYLFIFFF